MNNQPPINWQYDEFRQVGRNYGDPGEVDIYDPSHADFRDIEAEANRVLDTLALEPGARLIDFGCGTGTFAIAAARRCAGVDAVDVSPAMLDFAKAKAARAGVDNIRFHHAGFLTYEHAGRPADAITSTFAFHHLPDYWKFIALTRLASHLRPGGLFHLHDVIIEAGQSIDHINAFIARQEQAGGRFLREDAEGHFRDEFSTFDWILDGLLTRAGFTIRSKTIDQGVLGTYLCTRTSPAAG